MATPATVNSLNTLKNATEFFHNINIPSTFISNSYIDIELECPSQTTTAIDFSTGSPLSNFYMNLVIVDEHLERKYDSVLTPHIDMHNHNSSHLPIKSSNS